MKKYGSLQKKMRHFLIGYAAVLEGRPRFVMLFWATGSERNGVFYGQTTVFRYFSL